MKFTYAYKTSDGVRHEAELEAPSREAAFSALRAQGIKAIKVVAADGSKANGEVVVRGVRKRVVAVLVTLLLLAAAAGIVLAFRAGKSTQSGNPQPPSRPATLLAPLQRRQLPATVSAPFPFALERLLASFARPGTLDESAWTETALRDALADLTPALRTPLRATPGETDDTLALKRIVTGLKDELRLALTSGESPETVIRRFIARQRMEADYRDTLLREISRLKDPGEKKRRENTLRLMGLTE